MNEKIMKNIIANVNCGHCGQHCEPADIDLLGQQEDLWLLSVCCPSCKSRGIVVADIKESEKPETMLESLKIKMPDSSTPVDSSDVLDIHIFLKDFRGDFLSLFSEK